MTYHRQQDGQTEVVNRCLKAYLRCIASEKLAQWLKWLPWAEFWFNSTYNSSTCMTPFQALYGRDPPTIFRGEMFLSKVEEVRKLIWLNWVQISPLLSSVCDNKPTSIVGQWFFLWEIGLI